MNQHVCRIEYKYTIINKKTVDLIFKKWAKGLNRHFIKNIYKFTC